MSSPPPTSNPDAWPEILKYLETLLEASAEPIRSESNLLGQIDFLQWCLSREANNNAAAIYFGLPTTFSHSLTPVDATIEEFEKLTAFYDAQQRIRTESAGSKRHAMLQTLVKQLVGMMGHDHFDRCREARRRGETEPRLDGETAEKIIAWEICRRAIELIASRKALAHTLRASHVSLGYWK